MKRALGVCYYPEHWPEDEWALDAQQMVDTGIAWVRIGEFAWSRLEPVPGQFDFDWLDRAINTLAAAGLRLVLGTPTATPPRWMIDRYPDMLAVAADGAPRGFGSRRHYCFSHAGYRSECERIARVLGERYGRDPRIHAWQIDNEYDCHDTALSWSPAALAGFQAWCAARYGTIDALNAAWGNVFWSMEYSRFDQIGLPNQTVTEPNPSHVMAFRRYTSDAVVAFNRAQVDVLRPLTDAPLIHNYMGRILAFDHFAVGRDLDIASWDSYPLGFPFDRIEGDGASRLRFLRQGDPDFQAFHHDLYRAVGRGRWWVMEQQPGPVNWAPYNTAPLDGMVRVWTWEAFAHGAEVVSYFRWRQAPFAQEQMHAGLLRPDRVPAPGRAEAIQVASEIAALPDIAPVQAPVAIVFDYASVWAWETQPQGADFDYFRLVFSAYRALRRAGLSVDIVPADDPDLTGYALTLVPGCATLSDALQTAVAEASGAVLVGPRSNAKTTEMAIPVPLPPALPWLDITVARTESLPPDYVSRVPGGGAIGHWLEHLEGSAPRLLETEDGHTVLVGTARKAYLGAWPNDALWDRIIADKATEVGLSCAKMPDGVRLRDTATHRFAINYGAEAATVDGHTVGPADVAWWPRERD